MNIGGMTGGSRVSTAAVDGTFAFESVPGGAFTLRAVSFDGLVGTAESRLDSEGEIVDVELTIEGSGGIDGTVLDAFGSPVAAASVTLTDSS